MQNFKVECVEETSNRIIKFEENKRSIVFLNPARKDFLKVHIDGCQITEGPKCDQLLVEKKVGHEYFIELKGVDISHALEQLDCTMAQLSDMMNKDKTVKAYIIPTNVSPLLTAKVQKYRKKFRQQYSAELIIKERTLTVSV